MEKGNIQNHSLWILISYNFSEFASQILSKSFSSLYLFYYETELLLAGGFIIAAQVIFSIWNAINDPIAGYMANKPTRWTKKYGRQFPWILASGIPMFLVYFLLFAPPQSFNDWGIFFWLVGILSLADTFASVYFTNTGSMYPEKFRSSTDRRRSGQVNAIIGSIGMVFASVLPPLFYKFGDPSSYTLMGVIMAGFGIFTVILNIPGVKADEHMLQQNFALENEESFIDIFKESMGQRNFVIYVAVIFLYGIYSTFALTSLPYFIKNVMQEAAAIQTYIWGGMILGILISIPLWNIFYKKYGVSNTLLVGFIIMGIGVIPLLFVTTLIAVIIVFFIVGTGLGGFWVSYLPFFGEVMDEVFVNTGKKNSGVYLGIRSFFNKFIIIVQTVLFITIHKFTGYIAGDVKQNEKAIFGIKIHAVIIPIISVVIGSFLLHKLYNNKNDNWHKKE